MELVALFSRSGETTESVEATVAISRMMEGFLASLASCVAAANVVKWKRPPAMRFAGPWPTATPSGPGS